MTGDLDREIVAIDRRRARLGLVALVCAVIAVGLVALGFASAGPGRLVALALLALGGLVIALRLRLAWRRVILAKRAASADARRRLDDAPPNS